MRKAWIGEGRERALLSSDLEGAARLAYCGLQPEAPPRLVSGVYPTSGHLSFPLGLVWLA